MAKLIFGCGYLGFRIAKLWRQRGESVLAVTRSAARSREFSVEGIEPLVGDILSSGSNASANWRFPADVDTVLFAVGYDRSSRHAIHDVYVEGLRHVLESLPGSVQRFIYISSTGVYGTVAGDWVNEDTACQPTREGGKACLAAENLLRSHPLGERSIILRLAGIYGPGRISRAKDLLAGKLIDAPAAGYLNLIHVDDAAQIVLLCDERAALPSLYVVSDGQPVVRSEYYKLFAQLLNAPPPQFAAPPPDSPAAQRAGSDKRVNAARLMRELNPALLHPSYREGLAAIVAEDSNSS